MPSSFNIIRGVEVVKGGVRPLALRYQFAQEDDQNKEVQVPEELLNEAREILKKAGEDAVAIVDTATAEAADIIRNALEDARRESSAIKEEARETGFAQGKKEALAKAAAEATAIRDQARSVLRQAEEMRRKTLASLEGEIIELAKEIAQKILHSELAQNTETVLAVAREAIGLLENREEVILYVHPTQVNFFESKKEKFQHALPPKGILHIIADPGIEPGGCVAETQYGKVDAGLDARWRALVRALDGEEG